MDNEAIGRLLPELFSEMCDYSVRKLFTGFANAAFIAWKLIVARAMCDFDTLACSFPVQRDPVPADVTGKQLPQIFV